MFNKITSFNVEFRDIEILDNEFVKTASEILLPEGHVYDPDFTYMKVRAVSAGEYWGNNKNADFFPEEELKKNYKTFFDAHVFKNHENKDVEKAIGDVLDAVWNDEMKYVELFIRVDKRIAPTIARGFEKGFMSDVSMGCKIDHSICSICGNVAKTQSQYCDHIKYEKHKVYSDGRKVFEININPRFHDISAVLNGADRTAKMTGLYISGSKVAFHGDDSMEKCASFSDELKKEAELREEFKAREKYNREKKKKKEKIKDNDLEYYMKGHVGAGIKKTASLADELLDSEPLFEKKATEKLSPKDLEMHKIAEIKKRIKGKVLGVARQRVNLEKEDDFKTGMNEYHRTHLGSIGNDKIDGIAKRISYISDRENIPVEQVITSLLKVLVMAGIRLAPREFSRLMHSSFHHDSGGFGDIVEPRRTPVTVSCSGRDGHGHGDFEESVMKRLTTVNTPTAIRVVRISRSLPSVDTVMSSGSHEGGKMILRKIAGSELNLPVTDMPFIEGELVKIASELMDKRSLHVEYMLKRAEQMEAEGLEKVASADDFVLQYENYMGEGASIIEELEKCAYASYMNMALSYTQSDELEADLYKNAEELGLDNGELEKAASWKPVKTIPVGVGTYLYSKYQGVKAREGKPLSTVQRTMAENPQSAALGAYMAANVGISGAGKAKDAMNKGVKVGTKAFGSSKVKQEAVKGAEKMTRAQKIKKGLSKKASDNVDKYLNLRMEDEIYDNIEDDLQDIDLFKDKVVEEKLASVYSQEEISFIKMATVMYAQERQDIADNILVPRGLDYSDMGIFLEACEETIVEELEKKANILKGVASAAKPLVNGVLGAAKSTSKAMQPVKEAVKPKLDSLMAKPGAKMAAKTLGTGVGTGVGAGVVNKAMGGNTNANKTNGTGTVNINLNGQNSNQ